MTGETFAEVWLLDVSGSMRGKSIELMRKYVRELHKGSPHVRLVPFNTFVLPVMTVDALDSIKPDGGTELHLALDFAAEKMVGQTVVFTDGEPSDQDACFKAADKVPGVIHVIHCGESEDRDAIRFCEKLSRRNGGSFVSKDIRRGETLLCAEVRSLLALPAPVAL